MNNFSRLELLDYGQFFRGKSKSAFLGQKKENGITLFDGQRELERVVRAAQVDSQIVRAHLD